MARGSPQPLPPTEYDRRVFGSPPLPHLPSSPISSPESQYPEPLYIEINIPLPPLPQPVKTSTPVAASGSRDRAHTLHSLSPFHRRRASSPTADKATGKAKAEGKESELSPASPAAAWMKSMTTGRKRNQTVDALAVVPAVLMLRAELFTPCTEEEEEKRLEDGKEGVK